MKIHEPTNFTKTEKNIQNPFDNYAGFDGKGGYHGSGGHGGNQINLFPNSQKQQNNLTFQKDLNHNQDSFMNLNQVQLNREQRALYTMMPQKYAAAAQQSGQSSPKIHKIDFLNQNEMKNLLENKFAPSMKDMIAQHNISATQSDENSMSPFMKSNNNNLQYLYDNSQNSLIPAGYENFGPQMLSKEQLFKIRQGQADLAKKLKNVKQNNNNADQNLNQNKQQQYQNKTVNNQNQKQHNQNTFSQSIFPKIDDNKEKNLFNQIEIPEKFISDKASYLLTGEKKLRIKSQNIENQNLIPQQKHIDQLKNKNTLQPSSINQTIKDQFLGNQLEIKNNKRKESLDYLQDFRNFDDNIQKLKYPPLFKQQNFCKNTGQKSQFTKQIENNGQIKNKHYLDFNSFRSLQYDPTTRAASNIFRRQLDDDIKKKDISNDKTFESKRDLSLDIKNTLSSLDAIRIPLDVQILQNNGSKLQIFDEKSIQDDRYFQYNIEKIEEALKNKKIEYQALKQKIQNNGDFKEQQRLVDLANQINFQRKQIFLIQSQYLGSETKFDKSRLNIESSRNQSNQKVLSKFEKLNESTFKNNLEVEDSIFSSVQKKYNSSLKQSVMPQSHRINSQNARTNQSSFNVHSTLDVKQEFSALHIYDSLLLSKKVEEMVLKEKFEKRKFEQSFQLNLKESSQALNFQANTIIQNEIDQKNRPLEDIEESYSSSAQSNFKTINLGEQKIETLKGTNITQLSPITRQMNKKTQATLNQLEQFFISQSDADKSKKDKDNKEMSKEYKLKMEENQKAIKIMKYQLVNLVAPESEKYQLITPNNEYNTIEILPEMIPVYLKVPCSLLKSPCFFEVLMNDIDVMHVLMSTTHRFPKEENQMFEQEKLVIQEKVNKFLETKQSYNQNVQVEDKKKNTNKKTSIVQMEIFSKLKNRIEEMVEQKKITIEVSQKKKKMEEQEKLLQTRQLFKFVKQNFQENFDQGDQIYIAIISQAGGSIRLRASCNVQPIEGKEEVTIDIDKKQNTVVQLSQEDLIIELKEWFDKNVHMLNYYINQNALNFLELNKQNRLQNFYYKNQASIQQNKIMQNQQKRESALEKAEILTVQKYQKNKQYLQKWDNYRETKIEMTAIFIKILKKKNFTRRWLKIQKQIQIFSKIIENLFIRRDLNHILFTSIHTAIRFKISYLYRYRKQYGFIMEQRQKNEIRRSLNFGAISKYNTIIQDVKMRFASFIFKTFLVFNTCQSFKYFNDNLLYIQLKRRQLQVIRDSQWKLLYKKLIILKDCLIQFYAKKKSKKHGQKLIKALKKNFGQGRNEDYKMVKKVAYDQWGKKNMMETQNLFDSIKIRGLIIYYQLLGKCTLKDEEGNKIYKTLIEELKLQVESVLKKIRKQTKEIDKVERDLWSWPDKEIKDLQKKAKFRKPDPKDVDLAEIHKFDTSKLIKDDKLLKFCKTQYAKMLMPKKNSPVKGKKDGKFSQNKGSIDQQNEADEQAVDGDGQDGADMEGDEMEGDEGDNNAQKGDEGNEGDGAEDKEDGAVKAEEEAGEEEGEEPAASDQENNKDDQQDQADDNKDQGENEQSPAKKKASRSVSKTKVVKKKNNDDVVALIVQKPNPKIKGKYIVDEKIQNPQNIIDYVENEYPEPQSEDQTEHNSFNMITPQQLKDIIEKLYTKQEKEKLIKMSKSQKIKNDLTTMIRIILHLGLNIGPQQQLNEDIEENIKDNDHNTQFGQTVFELTAAKDHANEDQAQKIKGKHQTKLKSTQEHSEENKTPLSPKSKDNEKECSKQTKKALSKINLSNQNNSQDDHKTLLNEQIPTNQSIGHIQDGIDTFFE